MNAADDTVCVYSAEVMHRRFTTAQYRFRYRIFSVLLDIDGIEQAAASTRLFSLNRWAFEPTADCSGIPVFILGFLLTRF